MPVSVPAQVEILKTEMPSLIDSQEACIRWGTHMYRVGSFKLTFGIPGEFTCFECGREFSEVSEKHAHILEEHTSPPPYSCQECTDTGETLTFLRNLHLLLSKSKRYFSQIYVRFTVSTVDLSGLSIQDQFILQKVLHDQL